MTRRMVIWVPGAEAELTEIWLASNNRTRITSASHQIDSALGSDAESVAVPLTEGLHALEEPPLRVLFEILDERIVRILKVKLVASH